MIYDDNEGDLSDLAKVARLAAADLAPVKGRFDAIVACGMSGVLVASPVACEIGVPLVVVRKRSDEHHAHAGGIGGSVINDSALRPGSPYLFVDDFINYGGTIKHVRRSFAAAFRPGPVPVLAGTYLYDPDEGAERLKWEGCDDWAWWEVPADAAA